MDSRLREKLVAAAGIVLAVVIGYQIANRSLFLAGVLGGAGVLLVAYQWIRIPADAFVTGLVLLGYLIGNRGFAQLHIPNVPLLPGEFALGLALAFHLWRSARTRGGLWRTDGLNVAVLAWVAVCSIRIPFDFREHGFLAVRDFAMVYYALFFLVAQEWCGHRRAVLWLTVCLHVGLAMGPVVFLLFRQWPDVFINHLVVAGVPLIFVKGDVAAAFAAGGTFWFLRFFARSRRLGWLALVALCLCTVLVSNSRAALVAVMVGIGWLTLARAWVAWRTLLALLGAGMLGLAAHAAFTEQPMVRTPLYRVYESALSVLDVTGQQVYRAETLGDKSDNNQFRIVWWAAVVDETWEESPLFGLGFGHGLADEFLRIYYGDVNEEFTARSPHNFLLSVFGRAGLVGLLAFFWVLGAMAERTYRALRHDRGAGEIEAGAHVWLAVWPVFTSACFGVVLEAPMGAVVFWVALGLANGQLAAAEETSDTATAAHGRARTHRSAEPAAVPLLRAQAPASPLLASPTSEPPRAHRLP